MKIITKPKKMRKALKKLNANRIAVAYLGKNWLKYIDIKHLEEIIVSPTLGSNPNAIFEVAQQIGWDNVYFLDELHSKVYLSQNRVLVGSANLSSNAFGDARKLEILIKTQKTVAVKKLHQTLDGYVILAKERYPSTKSKLDRLDELRKISDKSIWSVSNPEILQAEPAITSLSTEQLRNYNIHIIWYAGGPIDFNMDTLSKQLGLKDNAHAEHYFHDCSNFHENYGIKKGDWILWWKAREDGYPHKGCNVYWRQVHAVVSQGIVADPPHTKLVAEIKSYTLPPKPFELTTEIQQLIKEQLNNEKYDKLRNPDDADLTRTESLTEAFNFLSDLRSHLDNSR